MIRDLKENQPCLCYSGKTYGECCYPLHAGKPAETALQLMRSRYCGYALGKVDYIIETTHEENPQAKLSMAERRNQIMTFCQETDFIGLEILNVEEGNDESVVLFEAKLQQGNRDCSFIEKSAFRKEGGKWFYKAVLA